MLHEIEDDDEPILPITYRYATYMNRDTPNYENIAKSVKAEMTDFVSYYRWVRDWVTMVMIKGRLIDDAIFPLYPYMYDEL